MGNEQVGQPKEVPHGVENIGRGQMGQHASGKAGFDQIERDQAVQQSDENDGVAEKENDKDRKTSKESKEMMRTPYQEYLFENNEWLAENKVCGLDNNTLDFTLKHSEKLLQIVVY